MRRTPPVTTNATSWMVDADGSQWYRMVDPRQGIADMESMFNISLPASAARLYFTNVNQAASKPVTGFVDRCMDVHRLSRFVDALEGATFLQRFKDDPHNLDESRYADDQGLVGDVYRECSKAPSPFPVGVRMAGVLVEVLKPKASTNGLLTLSTDQLDHIVEPVARAIKESDTLEHIKQEAATGRITVIMCNHRDTIPLLPHDEAVFDEMCSAKGRRGATWLVAKMARDAGATREQANLMVERILE